MNTKLTLKNFRVFDNKQGGTFNLAPITILTGCNSSGKSSVVKALLLLKDFFQELNSNNIYDCKLDFGNRLAKLGKFDTTRNNRSRRGSKISFEYTIRPGKMSQDLCVKLSFDTNDKDTLNNGYLSDILITKKDSKSVVLDVCRSIHDEDHLRYMIRKIDLNSIAFDFLKSRLGNLILDCAHNTFPTSNTFGESFTEQDLESVNGLLKVYRDYCTVEEYNNFVAKVQSKLGLIVEYGSVPTTTMRRQITNAFSNSLLFDLPLFEWLKDVQKSDVRQVLYDKITTPSSEKKQFRYKWALDAILDSFEESKYATFIEYFRDCETKGLVFENISGAEVDTPLWLDCMGFSTISEIANYIGYNPHILKWVGDTIPFSVILNTLLAVCSFTIPSFYEDELAKKMDMNYIVEYKLLVEIREFYREIINQSLAPIDFFNFEYIGDSFINIQRLYTSVSNDEFGKSLFRYSEACMQNEWQDIDNGDFINKWIKRFGLGDHLSISNTAEGLGLIVKIHKTKNDKHGRLLADEGFGITKLVGTMINIETAILNAKRNNDTSYGIAVDKKQRYPKVARAIMTLAIEEPENHLHPRYQALLAEMFADAYKNYGIHFIVETHSEYMVRKLQTLVAKKELTPAEVSLQYLYNPDIELRPKGEPQVKDIPIGEDGILKDTFGPGFMDEADNLAMDILTIKAMS